LVEQALDVDALYLWLTAIGDVLLRQFVSMETGMCGWKSMKITAEHSTTITSHTTSGSV